MAINRTEEDKSTRNNNSKLVKCLKYRLFYSSPKLNHVNF